MADKWFMASKGKGYGPFSASQLQQMVEAGVIDHDDLVWREGGLESAPASTVGNEPPPRPVAASRPSLPPPPVPSTPTSSPRPSQFGLRLAIAAVLLAILGGGGWFAFDRGWLPLGERSNFSDASVAGSPSANHATDDEAEEPAKSPSPNEGHESEVATTNPVEPKGSDTVVPRSSPEDSPPRISTTDQRPEVPVRPSNEPEQVRTFQKHDDHVLCVDFSPDGRHIVSGSRDKSVRVWNVDSGQQEWSWSGFTEWVRSVRFSPDGSRVFACAKNRCAILDAASGRLIDSFETANSHVIVLSRDCSLIAAIQKDQQGTVFDIRRRQAVHRISSPSVVSCAAFAPDNSEVLFGWARLHRLQMANGDFTRTHIVQDSASYIIGLDYSPDGSLVATGSHKIWTAESTTIMGDRMVRIWNARTGTLVRELRGHRDWINAIAFTPDGTRILSAGGGNPEDWGGFGSSCDRSIWLWETSTGRVLHTFKGHRGAVMAVAVSPDSRLAVSGSSDGTLILWRLPEYPD